MAFDPAPGRLSPPGWARVTGPAMGLPLGPCDVRVGIVSWNTAVLLDGCLSALPAALGDLRAEVVVVDNASSDPSAEVARRHPVCLIVNAENRGYARAMNQALNGSRAEVLIALNPDTVPGPGSLERLVRSMREGDPDVGLLAPRLLHPDGRVQHSVHRFPSPAIYALSWFLPRSMQRGRLAQRFWLEGRAAHDRTQDVDWAIGAVHAIRAAALGSRAPYDERWFMYVEDLELCWWLAGRGWRRRLEASAEVVHISNAAGAQAWGSGRTRRHVAAAYDWSRRDVGEWATRRWALVNVAGTLWWSAIQVLSAMARGRPGAAAAARDALSVLPVHLAAVVGRRDRRASGR